MHNPKSKPFAEENLEITRMIREAKSTDGCNALMEAVYPELKRIAKAKIASFSQAGDLQATEVVNDVFLELQKVLQRENVTFENRKKFFGYASTVAYHDILRSRKLAERCLELDESAPGVAVDQEATLGIRRVLERLGNRYPKAVKALYLREVIELSLEEIAGAMEYNSVNTLRSDLVMIRKKVREAFASERSKPV